MISCPCCLSQATEPFCEGNDRLFRTTSRKFQLLRCQKCSVIFLSPIPTREELVSYYPRGYWWQTSAASQRKTVWHRVLETYRRLMTGAHVRRVRRLILRDGTTPGRLLDLGCGDGLFLGCCQSLPPDRISARLGAEQSIDALRAARLRGGLRLIQADLEALPFAPGSMKAITMFHVLEHLSAPHPFLEELHRLLEPGGWLIVQVPNAASWQQKLLGRHWAGFDVPRHLVNYSPENLPALLESKGFRVARVGHFSSRDNPATFVMSLFPWLYPPARRLRVARRGGGSAIFNAILDLAFFGLVLAATPMAWIESLAHRGGSIVVEARKI